MPFILLKPSKSRKGIIVLKHLELFAFKSLKKRHRIEIKKKYLIGIYFGYSYILVEDIPFADFYLAEDNVINFINFKSSMPRCNLNGYNFLTVPIKNRNTTKLFDFLFIGNSSKRKNLIFFLNALKLTINKSKNIKLNIALIVVHQNSYLNNYELSKCERLISELKTEKCQFTYIKIDAKKNFKLPKNTIDLFYKNSRNLVLCSYGEGAARVVAEAKLHGLGVLFYELTKGGSRNHFNEKYDFIFSNIEEFSRAILSSLNNKRMDQKTLDYYKTIFSETNSKQKLAEFLSYQFSFDLNELKNYFRKLNLMNSFQSHNQFLPREIPSVEKTDECLTPSSMTRLYEYLFFGKPRIKFSFRDFNYLLKIKIDFLISAFKYVISKYS